MLSDNVMSMVRMILSLLAGWLVTKGVIDAQATGDFVANTSTFIGGGIAGVVYLSAVYKNWQNHRAKAVSAKLGYAVKTPVVGAVTIANAKAAGS